MPEPGRVAGWIIAISSLDTWQAVNTIRVIRAYSDTSVSEALVTQIVNAGRRAGSSKNLQRWEFVVVRDPPQRAALSGTGPFAGHLAAANDVIALVTPDPHAEDAPLSIIFDIGRAAQNMMLVAWSNGIGSCPATRYDQTKARQILK